MAEREDDDLDLSFLEEEEEQDDEELDNEEEEDEEEEDIDIELDDDDDDEPQPKKKAKAKKQDDDDEDDDDGEDEDERISRIVKGALKETQKSQSAKQQLAERSSELKDFIKDNPDMKKFVPKLKQMATHKNWKNVPIEAIAHTVAPKTMRRILAEKSAKVTEKAKKTNLGGATKRPEEKTPVEKKSAWDLSSDQFNQVRQRALRGEFVSKK